jgi:Leu/Phe-tRNA-protein transferase
MKEKAEELVRKYYTFGINKEGQTLSWYECKQCALIAIEEILLHVDKSYHNESVTEGAKSYWNQVKQEIENL